MTELAAYHVRRFSLLHSSHDFLQLHISFNILVLPRTSYNSLWVRAVQRNRFCAFEIHIILTSWKENFENVSIFLSEKKNAERKRTKKEDVLEIFNKNLYGKLTFSLFSLNISMISASIRSISCTFKCRPAMLIARLNSSCQAIYKYLGRTNYT